MKTGRSVRGQRATTRKKPELDYYPTPDWLVSKMVSWALLTEIKPKNIIDPCAGDNRILQYAAAKYTKHYYCAMDKDKVQRDDVNIEMTVFSYEDLFASNFFEHKKFDIAIMNPPFSGLQVFHFSQELIKKWLNPGWKIVTLAPNYYLDNSDRRKKWLNQYLTRVGLFPKTTFRPYADTIHGAVWMLEDNKQGATRLEFIREEGRYEQIKMEEK